MMAILHYILHHTPPAILVSALVGAGVAIYTVYRQTRIARLRSTLQFAVGREVHDTYWSQTRREADILLLAPDHNQEYWAKAIEELDAGKDKKDIMVLRGFLNHYELVATGIRHKIIDKRFYEEWAKPVVKLNWERSHRFVEAVRARPGQKDAFREFQNLAEEWGAKKLKEPPAAG